MTDEQIYERIDQARENLKIALSAVVNNKSTAHAFELGMLPLPNGERWNLTCFIAVEPVAQLIEAVLNGIDKANQSYQKALTPPKVPTQ